MRKIGQIITLKPKDPCNQIFIDGISISLSTTELEKGAPKEFCRLVFLQTNLEKEIEFFMFVGHLFNPDKNIIFEVGFTRPVKADMTQEQIDLLQLNNLFVKNELIDNLLEEKPQIKEMLDSIKPLIEEIRDNYLISLKKRSNMLAFKSLTAL